MEKVLVILKTENNFQYSLIVIYLTAFHNWRFIWKCVNVQFINYFWSFSCCSPNLIRRQTFMKLFQDPHYRITVFLTFCIVYKIMKKHMVTVIHLIELWSSYNQIGDVWATSSRIEISSQTLSMQIKSLSA